MGKTDGPFANPFKLENGLNYCTLLDGRQWCTGSKMGRRDVWPEDLQAPVKLHLWLLPLVDSGQCYDQGGAYWGCNSPQGGFMYIAYSSDMKSVRIFLRGHGKTSKQRREDAKQQIRKRLPNVTFYR